MSGKELTALRQGLNDLTPKVSRRDSDLDVDEEYERKMNLVNDANSSISTSRDTISDGSPIATGTKHHTKSADVGGAGGFTDINASIKQRKVKILMLGDSGVGKTSLMSRWTEDTFNPNMVGTLGVDFKMKSIMVEGCHVQVQVWDTAGQERFRKITRAYYRNAHGIVLVYDCCGRESFENISYWMQNIQEHSGDGVQVAVVGNKIDLREVHRGQTDFDQSELVEHAEAAPLAAENEVDFYEASAKEKTGVESCFTELIAKVVRAQLESESREEDISGNGSGEKRKKKKFKMKSPKIVKGIMKGGKKMASNGKCTLS